MQIDVFQASVLGAVQGVTEFLPVSSRAHLVLIPWLFGWQDPGLTFDVALHLGTLAALLLYFRKDWLYLATSAFRIFRGGTLDPDCKLAWLIVLATIPAAIAGLLLDKWEDRLSTPTIIGIMLIAVAIAMRFAEIYGSREYELDTVTLADALIIGASQALAIIPGVSRSGVTITAGLFRGMKRTASAQFSFLLSAPIVGGAVVMKMFEVMRDGLPPDQVTPFIVGIVVSTIVGMISIAGLLRYLQNRTTFIFINYRIVLGIAVLSLGYFYSLQ